MGNRRGGEGRASGKNVAKLTGNTQDVLSRLFAHTRLVVEHPGDRPDRDTGFLGNLANGDQLLLAFVNVY